MPTRENEHIQHIFFWPFGLKKLLKYLSEKKIEVKKNLFCLSFWAIQRQNRTKTHFSTKKWKTGIFLALHGSWWELIFYWAHFSITVCSTGIDTIHVRNNTLYFTSATGYEPVGESAVCDQLNIEGQNFDNQFSNQHTTYIWFFRVMSAHYLRMAWNLQFSHRLWYFLGKFVKSQILKFFWRLWLIKI